MTAEMYEQINRLNKEYGITIIMISHDIGAAVRFASHILHISHKPLFFGTKEAYLKSKIGMMFTEGGDLA